MHKLTLPTLLILVIGCSKGAAPTKANYDKIVEFETTLPQAIAILGSDYRAEPDPEPADHIGRKWIVSAGREKGFDYIGKKEGHFDWYRWFNKKGEMATALIFGRDPNKKDQTPVVIFKEPGEAD